MRQSARVDALSFVVPALAGDCGHFAWGARTPPEGATTSATFATKLRVCVALLLAFPAAPASAENLTPPNFPASNAPDFERLQTWVQTHWLQSGHEPFSFQYSGEDSRVFLRTWERSQTQADAPENRQRYNIIYREASGLTLHCDLVVFEQLPAVEWVLRFKNEGASDTAIVADVHAVDAAAVLTRDSASLHYTAGCYEGVAARQEDFAPHSDPLVMGNQRHFAAQHGRSAWSDALPFFNIEAGGAATPHGCVLAIGWTGQWFANFLQDEDGVDVQAGMEGIHLRLRPGEEIRSPRIVMLCWQGHRLYGQNLLRRFLLTHHYRQRDGKPLNQPFLASSAAIYHEAFDATVKNQIEYARKFAPLGFEYLWMDVGWHVTKPQSSHIGPPDPERFPDGLRPLTDELKNLDMGLLLWHAPEFQGGGSWMEQQHPERFLSLKDPQVSGIKMLNFGDPVARKMLIDYSDKFVKEHGIGIYRWDGPLGSNLKNPDGTPYPYFQPLQWWREQDEPDRQGITEIRYVEGLYKFWDTMIERNPHLLFDLCGGGATRIDLESIKRCFFLWRSDWDHPGFEPNGHQSHTYGLNQWIPTTGTASGYPDAYSFRSAMNNGMAMAWNPYDDVTPRWPLAFIPKQAVGYRAEEKPRTIVDESEQPGWIPTEPFPQERAAALCAEFKRLRHLFHKDFYPLTPFSHEPDVWIAYQNHDPVADEGMVLAFRRQDCREASIKLRLWGLNESHDYKVTFVDTGERLVASGKSLASGFTITAADTPAAVLISYAQHDGT